MKIRFCFDGSQGRISKVGSEYSEVFLKPVDEQGNVAIRQVRYMGFDAKVGASCKRMKPGTLVDVDLDIKDAVVKSIEEVGYDV